MSDENQQLISETESIKEKVSLHLPVETVKKLEGMVYHARQEIPRQKAKQLTKSKLTELIIKALIWEYEEGKGKAVITRIVLDWVEN